MTGFGSAPIKAYKGNKGFNAFGGGVALPVPFAYTGADQTWVVPAGCTSITVTLYGAQGGNTVNDGGTNKPGALGGMVKGTLVVTPGTTLHIFVGGQGAGPASGAGGGFNGGGTAQINGAGGGGATDIRNPAAALADRLMVAGGGGGGAISTNSWGLVDAGVGGYPNGGTGGVQPQAGQGATNSAGGAHGTATTTGNQATDGVLGIGGGGGNLTTAGEGGGGGGGLYGGGGGAGDSFATTAAGGGGGSGFLGVATATSFANGVNTGNGSAVIQPN